jgi:hypothetical protein
MAKTHPGASALPTMTSLSGTIALFVTAFPYALSTWDFPYKIDHDDLCFIVFTEAGFEWGGDWTSCKDFQHFELIEPEEP